MRTVISRRVNKRAPVVRVSVLKDLTGEVLPLILLAPSPVLLGLLAARDCSEPRARSCRPNGIHRSPDSGLGEEVSFPQSRLPSRMLAGLGLTPAGTANPFPHGKLSLTPDTFLLSSRASDLHWTFQTCLSTGAITCPFSPLFQRVFFPGQGIPDEPPTVLPVVQIPDRERRLLETMQLAIEEFITDSSQGLPPSPRV